MCRREAEGAAAGTGGGHATTRQRLEGCGHQPGGLEPPEAGRGRRLLPRAPRDLVSDSGI